jgi:uncharacterized protein YecT (DUF1311 family)
MIRISFDCGDVGFMRAFLLALGIVFFSLDLGAAVAEDNQPPPDLDCENPGSNAEVNWCRYLESQKFDKEIVSYLKTLPRKILASTFANTNPTRAEQNRVLDRLMDEHDAWKKAQELSCENEMEASGAIGSGSAGFIADCLKKKARQRLRELKARYR